MFDTKLLAEISNVSEDSVRTFLPIVLAAVRGYTHRTFVSNVSISGNFTIKDGKLISSTKIPSNIQIGSIIELRYSKNNTKLYMVKSVLDNTIETYQKLFDEEFNGFVIMLSFKNVPDDIIATMINYKQTMIKHSIVKSESLDGYSYTLNVDNSSDYPLNILSGLNTLKQLPESFEREYYDNGFTKLSL